MRRAATPRSSAELFSDDRMSRHALSPADSQVVVKRAKPVTTLLTRVG